jgi:hypothetical protein
MPTFLFAKTTTSPFLITLRYLSSIYHVPSSVFRDILLFSWTWEKAYLQGPCT